MKILIITLLIGLLGYAISKPLDAKDATDALVEDWQHLALESWPLQPSPLTAYTSPGLNLLTTAQLPQNENKYEVQHTFPQPAIHLHHLPPQYLINQQQHFAYSNAFFKTPFDQYGYTVGQQYVPQFIAPLPGVTQVLSTDGKRAVGTTAVSNATKRPSIKDREPTTRKPQVKTQFKPPKLEAKPQKLRQDVGDLKSDAALLKAVEKINPEYVIEEIITVPGKHIYSTKATEQVIQSRHDQKLKTGHLVKKANKATDHTKSSIKVEATGKTSTKGNIPQIPFGTYFLPYFSQGQEQQKQSGKKPAALILEPHSKAVVGNGGTAISTPISKAFLKRGVTTNVFFNPESVAIAGVGGKAHAQADLELDLIN